MTELTPNPFAAPQTRERMANIAKGIGTFAFESLPGVSEYVTYKDIREELGKPKPNPYVIAGLGAAGIAGLIPGLGDLAAKGGRKIVDFAKRILLYRDKLSTEINSLKYNNLSKAIFIILL